MYRAEKIVYKHNPIENRVLRIMGYSAFKLWNVANYERRNYKTLGFSSRPNWYDQKKRLKDSFFARNLPAQTAQQVLKTLDKSWKSYDVLRKNGSILNPRPPRFKQDIMGFSFIQKSIKVEEGQVRLSISKQQYEYLRTIGVDAKFIYLKTKLFSNVNVKEVGIRFLDEETFSAVFVYELPEPAVQADNGHHLSIDLGLKNSMTCYDSEGTSFIVNGFLASTHYHDKKIAYYQGISAKQQTASGVRYPKPTKRVLSMYKKKKNKVDNFLHQSTRFITNYCAEHNISKVIVGDLKGIRKGRSIGRTNQQLHSFPYERFYQMLEYKLAQCGIEMIRQKEAYSSQCPPDSREVSKTYAVKKNRKHRGLYVDGEKVFNADCVGAYNIMRLYRQEKRLPDIPYGNLSSPEKYTF